MEKSWRIVIKPKTSIFDLNIREIWNYRDLCIMFVRKNYITRYKQTIFGSLYIFLYPLLTSGLFSVVFGTIIGVSTDGVPDFLFYMIGNLAWEFFTYCIYDNSNTFVYNAHIMGKVYFPRLIIPIANTLTNMINLLIQLILFVVFYFVFRIRGVEIKPNILVLMVPFLLLLLGLMGLGIGLVISSLTVKYRDWSVMIKFVMNLMMYITPIIYPISNLDGIWRKLILMNPVAPMIEMMRYAFFGAGVCSVPALLWSLAFTVLVDMAGLLMYNKVEKNFIDTV